MIGTTEAQKKANKKNIVLRSKYDQLLEKEGKSFIQTRFKFKFSKPEMFEVAKIKLRPEIFQGRSVPFAGETVEKIIREGYDTSQDPIIVFNDADKNENIVISGHSRFEAAKRLHEKGELSEIPVKFFNGDLDEAIDYALIESNRSGKAEGIESDIKAFVRAVDRGYNKEFLRSIFKEESYINILKNLAALNPHGRFIEYLAQGENNASKSIPYLLRNATWVGRLRLQYPMLTDDHELEMFNFLYNEGLKILKNDFFKIIEKKTGAYDFDELKPLGLSKTKEFENIKRPDAAITQYHAIENTLKEMSNDVYKKTEFAVRSELDNRGDDANRYNLQVPQILKGMKHKFVDFVRLEKTLKKENDRLKNTSLFGLSEFLPQWDSDFNGFSPTYRDLGESRNYASLIDKPDNKTVEYPDGDVSVTKKMIQDVVLNNYKAVSRLAKHLQAATVAQCAFNVWHWVRYNIRYELDTDGIEQVRTPQRSFAENRGDCDCFTVFAVCLFKCMKLENIQAHIVTFEGNSEPSHIYAFVGGFVVDSVSPVFNEVPKKIVESETQKMFFSTSDKIKGLAGLNIPLNSIFPKTADKIELFKPIALGLSSDGLPFYADAYRAGLAEIGWELCQSVEKMDLIPQLKKQACDRIFIEIQKHTPAENKGLSGWDNDAEIITNKADYALNMLSAQAFESAKKDLIVKWGISDISKLAMKIGGEIWAGSKWIGNKPLITALIDQRLIFLSLVKSNFGGLASKLAIGLTSIDTLTSNNFDLATWQKAQRTTKQILRFWESIGGDAVELTESILKAVTLTDVLQDGTPSFTGSGGQIIDYSGREQTASSSNGAGYGLGRFGLGSLYDSLVEMNTNLDSKFMTCINTILGGGEIQNDDAQNLATSMAYQLVGDSISPNCGEADDFLNLVNLNYSGIATKLLPLFISFDFQNFMAWETYMELMSLKTRVEALFISLGGQPDELKTKVVDSAKINPLTFSTGGLGRVFTGAASDVAKSNIIWAVVAPWIDEIRLTEILKNATNKTVYVPLESTVAEIDRIFSIAAKNAITGQVLVASEMTELNKAILAAQNDYLVSSPTKANIKAGPILKNNAKAAVPILTQPDVQPPDTSSSNKILIVSAVVLSGLLLSFGKAKKNKLKIGRRKK